MKKTKKTLSYSDKQPQNKLKTIKTGDGKQIKIIDSLLMKYSLFLKSLIQDQKSEEQILVIQQVDSESLQIINQFMQLHKEKQPTKIQLPLKTNQDLKLVIQQGDAILVQKIMNKGDQFLLKILQATSYLQVEQFKKRLIAGLAIKLMKNTVGQLKQQYGLQQYDVKDEQIREQAQRRLRQISQMKQLNQ